MESNLIYEKLPIRVTTDDDESVWFAGIDICKILGYVEARQTIERLDDDEKKLDGITDSSGQKRKTWMVNEFGLYSLILTSTKPEAKTFKRWITHEVLPSIRKAGKYSTEQEKQHDADLQILSNSINAKNDEIEELSNRLRTLRTEKKKLEFELHQEITRDRSQLKLQM